MESEAHRARGERLHAFLSSGMPVWVMIGRLRENNGDVGKAMDALYDSVTNSKPTEEDFDYALRYYKQHKKEIDRRLAQISDVPPLRQVTFPTHP